MEVFDKKLIFECYFKKQSSYQNLTKKLRNIFFGKLYTVKLFCNNNKFRPIFFEECMDIFDQKYYLRLYEKLSIIIFWKEIFRIKLFLRK